MVAIPCGFESHHRHHKKEGCKAASFFFVMWRDSNPFQCKMPVAAWRQKIRCPAGGASFRVYLDAIFGNQPVNDRCTVPYSTVLHIFHPSDEGLGFVQ